MNLPYLFQITFQFCLSNQKRRSNFTSMTECNASPVGFGSTGEKPPKKGFSHIICLVGSENTGIRFSNGLKKYLFSNFSRMIFPRLPRLTLGRLKAKGIEGDLPSIRQTSNKSLILIGLKPSPTMIDMNQANCR